MPSPQCPTILASLTRIQEQVGLLGVGRSYARKIRRAARWTRFNDRSTSAPEPPCQAMYAAPSTAGQGPHDDVAGGVGPGLDLRVPSCRRASAWCAGFSCASSCAMVAARWRPGIRRRRWMVPPVEKPWRPGRPSNRSTRTPRLAAARSSPWAASDGPRSAMSTDGSRRPRVCETSKHRDRDKRRPQVGRRATITIGRAPGLVFRPRRSQVRRPATCVHRAVASGSAIG